MSFGDEALPVIIQALGGANPGARYIVGNTFIRTSPHVLTNSALLQMLATGLQSADPETRDWSALMLRAADGQSRFSTPQPLWEQLEGISQIRRGATNSLRRLAPQLLRPNRR